MSEAAIGPYDPTTAAVRQDDNWSCSVCSICWMLQSIGLPVTEPQLEAQMLAAGLVTPAWGLMDGSAATVAQWLRETYGVPVEQVYPASAAWLLARISRGPVGMGGHAWNHWTAVRTADETGLYLANPSPNWQGVGDYMTADEWWQWGIWAALYIPVEEGDVSSAADQARIAELEAQVASLNTVVGEMQRVARDISLPRCDRILATADVPDSVRDEVAFGLVPDLQTIARAGAP